MLVQFRYNFFGRIIWSFLTLLLIVPGIIFIYFGGWFILLGSVFLSFSLFRGLDILFFKSFEFQTTHLVKRWYLFGSLRMSIKKMHITPVKRLFSGQIFFDDKKSSVFKRMIMSIEMYPIGNNEYKKFLEVSGQKGITILRVQGDSPNID